MGIRTVEEQELIVKACMRTSGIEESKMAKLLKMDVETFERKIRNHELNLLEVITFSNYCRLDTKQIFWVFFPNFNMAHKQRRR